MKKSKISLMLLFILVVITVSNSVFAVTTSIVDMTKEGSITITALSQANGSTDVATAKPLEGVTYALYRVDDVAGTTVTTVAQAEEYIKTTTAVQTKTTGSNGVASFSNLVLGRYYAKVTYVPTGTTEIPESFLVDVPMTNADGNGWTYDITVQPKVKVATGTVTVVKNDEKGAVMDNVTFKVQVSTEENVWQDYVPEGATTALELTTDTEGKIVLEDLPISYKGKLNAKYRVIEMAIGEKDGREVERYIIDNKNPEVIEVTPEGKIKVDGEEKDSFTITNEKPNVVKQVKNQAGEFSDLTSVYATDTIEFKITVDVPSVITDMKTFKVTDELPTAISNVENLTVKALVGSSNTEKTLVENTDYTKTGNFVLSFDTSKLEGVTTIIITYTSKLDMSNTTLGENGNVNTAELEYTNNVNIDGTEESKTTTTDTSKVVTGGIKIKKVNSDKELLSGAKFKIATTKANAENGTFVKGVDGQDIEVTTVNGYAEIKGLEYDEDETQNREYWLVETQAPTYEDNGETKTYTLLSAPKSVTVGPNTHTVDIEVENKKPISLPLTGGIGTIVFIIVGVALLIIAKSIKKEEVKD